MSENLFDEKNCYKPYDWIEDKDEIRVWAIRRDGIRSLLRIKDFPYSIILEFPSNYTKEKAIWFLDKILRSSYETFSIKNKIFYRRKKLYYYSEKHVSFLSLQFENKEEALKFKYKYDEIDLDSDSPSLSFVRLHIHEYDFSWYRKLWSKINLKPSQWFYCEHKKETEKISVLDEEYEISYKDIKPISFEESKYWKINFKVLSFDIECYSSEENKMPEANNFKDVVFLISLFFEHDEEKIIHLLVHEMSENEEVRNKFLNRISAFESKIPIRINFFKEEIDLLEFFLKLINDYDPEIISGYNITGFDFAYIDYRIQLRTKDCWNCSRLKDKRKDLLKTISWSSSAFGDVNISYPKLEGRIVIDMISFFKRFNPNFEFFNLKYVSKKLLSIEKIDLSPKELFVSYRIYRDAVKNNSLTEDEIKLYLKLIEYNIRDSVLVSNLLEKSNAIILLSEMSNILEVNIEDILIYGQQRKYLSQLYNRAKEEKVILNKIKTTPKEFKGAIVFDAKPGVYDNVICLDFASLYPSIVISYNICYTTLHNPDKKLKEEDKEKFNEIDIDGEKLYFLKSEYGEGLIPSLMRKLIMERRRINKEVAEIKKKYTSDNMPPEIKFNCNILEARAQSMKISANSIYGSLGAKDAKFPFFEGAMSVTAIGRQSFMKVSRELKERFEARQVYGDTDSVMVQIPFLFSSDQCHYWGRKLAEYINGIEPGNKDVDGNIYPEGRKALFPPPMSIEFEKAMKMILVTKKKYAYFLIDKDGTYKKDKENKEILLTKGTIIVRRDNCIFFKNLYRELIYLILRGSTFKETFSYFVSAIKDLFSGKIEPKLLCKVNEVKSDKRYKSDSAFMKQFKKKVKDSGGSELTIGERIEIIYLKVEGGKRTIEKAKLLKDFNPEEDEIDYEYYLDHLGRTQFEQLLLSAYSNDLNKYSSLEIKAGKRRNSIIFSEEPIKFISESIKLYGKEWYKILEQQILLS